MMGVKTGHLIITKHNGDRIRVEHVQGEDWIVRVPATWGEAWMAHMKDINDAVEAASMPTQPVVESAA